MMFYFTIPGETKNPVLTEEHIRALKILTFSDNRDLQTSAALCYSEVSEKSKYFRLFDL